MFLPAHGGLIALWSCSSPARGFLSALLLPTPWKIQLWGFFRLISRADQLYSGLGPRQDLVACLAFVPQRTENHVWSDRSVCSPLKYAVGTGMKTALSCRGPGLNRLCLRWCYYYPCVIDEGTEVEGRFADVSQSPARDSCNLWPPPQHSQ